MPGTLNTRAARSGVRPADPLRQRAAARAAGAELFVRLRRQQLRAGVRPRRSAMNAALPPVAIEGIAFWHTRLPGWDDCARSHSRRAGSTGSRGDATDADVCSRRLSDGVHPTRSRSHSKSRRARAKRQVARPRELRSVFASTHGDLGDQRLHVRDARGHADADLADEVPQFRAQRGRGLLEHRHCQSRAVHGDQRVSIYVRRALCWRPRRKSCATDSRSLYVAFDVESTGPLATVAPSRGLLGVALVLAPSGDESHRTLTLRVEQGSASNVTPARSTAAALVADNALAPCLPFFEALADPAAREVVLALSDHCLACRSR